MRAWLLLTVLVLAGCAYRQGYEFSNVRLGTSSIGNPSAASVLFDVANDGEPKDVLCEVHLLDEDGNVLRTGLVALNFRGVRRDESIAIAIPRGDLPTVTGASIGDCPSAPRPQRENRDVPVARSGSRFGL